LAHLTSDRTQVNARIVFWGISGAGVSTNLRVIHDKLRSDHRGELRTVPTRLDPTTTYEVLPIELGQVNGLRTQLQVVAVPCGAENAPTRKQLLDRIDGLVLVVDSRPDQVEANVESLAELRTALAAYGRTLEELPVVVQYNKRDASDPYVIEELHRRLNLQGAAVFEASAASGKGVLQTLTTISKRVIRVLRESDLTPETAEAEAAHAPEPAPAPEPVQAPAQAPEPEPIAEPEPMAQPLSADIDLMEDAILAEGAGDDASADAFGAAEETLGAAQQALDRPWDSMSEELKSGRGARIGPDFEIVSVGTARVAGNRKVQLPVVLGNPEGETVTLRLTVALDPLLDHEEE
jgi:signal recognition particle receptor subunit beta